MGDLLHKGRLGADQSWSSGCDSLFGAAHLHLITPLICPIWEKPGENRWENVRRTNLLTKSPLCGHACLIILSWDNHYSGRGIAGGGSRRDNNHPEEGRCKTNRPGSTAFFDTEKARPETEVKASTETKAKEEKTTAEKAAELKTVSLLFLVIYFSLLFLYFWSIFFLVLGWFYYYFSNYFLLFLVFRVTTF